MNFLNNHKNISLVYVIIAFYLVVILTNVFSLKTIKLDVKIIKYHPAVNIFIDRKYINKKNDILLENKFLIQQPRHNSQVIKIRSTKKVIIYRVLCKKNDNKFYRSWSRVNKEVEIKGITCIHNELVTKKYLPGIIRLLPGGPVSSDPILVELTNNNTKLELF